ncbi:MAG: ATP-binding protein [Elusimicrobiota bacterium]
MELIRRFLQPSQQSFFLFGPRGTGKSTWVQTTFPKAHHINLLEPDVFRRLSSHPEHLKELVEANLGRKSFLIDEVQKIPQLLGLVHYLIEKYPQIQFILTGSSARKLKKTGVDLLAGRAVLKYMHPFIASELREKFSLNKALDQGLIPLVYQSQNPAETLKAYLALYIREEVQMEGLTRNMGNFHRFLETIVFSHGSILNTNNISRESEVNRKTVDDYLSILEDLMIGFRLYVFTKKTKRETITHPKFYLFDSGVYQHLRTQGPSDIIEQSQGLALEGLVAQHLRAWKDYSLDKHDLFYWRTRHGVEVDFVIYGKKGFWAIEVKNSKKVRPEDLKGLHAFSEEFPDCKPLLLYRGKDRIKKNHILCMPIENFLLQLKPDQSLPE